MARLANLRDTHLTRDEIAATALRQFDERDNEPTIRSLATELRVTPTAIYHHFGSQAALFQSVVELVWDETTVCLLGLVPDLFTADPVEVLVASGLATRRTWLSHHRVARHMAATPEANRFIHDSVGLLADVFERLGLHGDEAAAAFHSYASFMIGAVLFAADRKTADERLAADLGPSWKPGLAAAGTADSSRSTREAFDAVMGLSLTDPARDEALFEQGLRRMVAGFTQITG